MSSISQNFRLFNVPNLSVPNFRFFLLMYPASARQDDGGLLQPQAIAQLETNVITSRKEYTFIGAATRYGSTCQNYPYGWRLVPRPG